jgi:polyisoprenoid-binding protein YceI
MVFGMTAATGLVAEPATYTIDPGHSSVAFTAKHMVVAKVRGAFDTFEGTIVYDPDDIEKSSVEVTIAAASVNTKNEKRDDDLRSDGFLGTEAFPTIIFKSTSVRRSADGYVAVGDLTIRGVTKSVEIPFQLSGPVTSPWGQSLIGVEGSLVMNRQDYGVSWSEKLDNGGLVVSDDVAIELNVEAKK